MRGGWMGPVLTDDQYRAKLKDSCVITEKGCWEWKLFRKPVPRHYGMTSYRGKAWLAHRLTYRLTKGEIPKGMVVMHSCDNPPCCNPDHLGLGTHKDNMADCRAKGRYPSANKTHCKRGHEFNEENTYIIKTPGEAFGLRACKVCMRERHKRMRELDPEAGKRRARAYRARKKALRNASTGSTVCE